MWSESRKIAGPCVGLVAADALEDAGAVVQPVRRRRGSSRRPSRRARRSSRSSRSRPCAKLTRACDEVDRRARPRSRSRSAGAAPPCASASPAPTQSSSCASSVRSARTRDDARQRERRDRARDEAGRRDDLRRRVATRAVAAPASSAILATSARRSPGTSATTNAAVAVEDERLDDLPRLAADRLGGRLGRRRPLRRTPRCGSRRRRRAATRRRARRAPASVIAAKATRATGSAASRVSAKQRSGRNVGRTGDEAGRDARCCSARSTRGSPRPPSGSRRTRRSSSASAATPRCAHRITAPLDEYERVRRKPTQLPARPRPRGDRGRARRPARAAATRSSRRWSATMRRIVDPRSIRAAASRRWLAHRMK